MSLADQNPESIRKVSSPLAPARRSRATSSSMKRAMPWAVLAAPLRSRACSASPVSALVASSGWSPRVWVEPSPAPCWWWPQTSQLVESTSTTSGPSPGPAPAAHARPRIASVTGVTR
jgi:hypothetical protein